MNLLNNEHEIISYYQISFKKIYIYKVAKLLAHTLVKFLNHKKEYSKCVKYNKIIQHKWKNDTRNETCTVWYSCRQPDTNYCWQTQKLKEKNDT